ncbi:hypothetical protein N7534_003544 [Penicillium rubens]|nr:hypothetical protein N7534_003544 [Penicillium rubens]
MDEKLEGWQGDRPLRSRFFPSRILATEFWVIVGARLVEGSNITVATAASRMCLRTMDFEVVAA